MLYTKKRLSFCFVPLMAGVMALGLTACGDDDSFSPANRDDDEEEIVDQSSESKDTGGENSSDSGKQGGSSSSSSVSDGGLGPAWKNASKYNLDDPCGVLAQCQDMDATDPSTWHFISRYEDGKLYSHEVIYSQPPYIYTNKIDSAGNRYRLENLYLNSKDKDFTSQSAYLRINKFCVESVGAEASLESCGLPSAGEKKMVYDPSWPTPADFLNPDIQYGELTDERDGNVYKTVEINGVRWMAQNLDLEYHLSVSESFCYKNDPKNCALYGHLYQWSAAIDSAGIYSDDAKGCGDGVKTCSMKGYVRGICPEGWHLPTSDEYKLLFNITEKNLGAKNAWPEGVESTDSLGFSLLPNGEYSFGYQDIDTAAYLWTSSELSSNEYRAFSAQSRRAESYTNDMSRSGFCAVRCVENDKDLIDSLDAAKAALKTGSFVDARDGQTYTTVVIGSKTWMSQSLNYNYNEGSALSACYSDDPTCKKYARKYNWMAAIDSAGLFSRGGVGCSSTEICGITGAVRGVCPEGWHLPTKAELKALYNFFSDMPSIFSYQQRGLHGVDLFEWNGFGSAYDVPLDNFGNLQNINFWSSEDGYETAIGVTLSLYSSNNRFEGHSKNGKLHVRCVMDE